MNTYGVGTESDEFAGLFEDLVPEAVPSGRVLYRPGDAVTNVLVVRGGYVALIGVVNGRRTILDIVGSGGAVNPEAIVEGFTCIAAETISDAVICAVPVAAVSPLLGQDEHRARMLVAAITRRSRIIQRQLLAMKCYSCRERVASFLIDLAAAQGSATMLSLPFDKWLLASWLGMSREALSRTFLRLRTSGVHVRNDTVEILDFEGLSRLVSSRLP
jgi:CRP/FNR family transcriptional activator FtrB